MQTALNFYQRLTHSWQVNNSLLCVGLDADRARLPAVFRKNRQSLFRFNREIIDATAAMACAFKPQIAYYSALGAERELVATIDYIKTNYPELVVILDAKRGDIGATAQHYAREAFDRYQADAVTVNPYLGSDGLQPFLSHTARGVFILCRTSNPSSSELQNWRCDGVPLYRRVADLAVNDWNAAQNVGLVVGATYPRVLAELRAQCAKMPFLVPGIGVQGGDLRATVTNGVTAAGTGLLINAARTILYASSAADFAEAAAREATRLCQQINDYRQP